MDTEKPCDLKFGFSPLHDFGLEDIEQRKKWNAEEVDRAVERKETFEWIAARVLPLLREHPDWKASEALSHLNGNIYIKSKIVLDWLWRVINSYTIMSPYTLAALRWIGKEAQEINFGDAFSSRVAVAEIGTDMGAYSETAEKLVRAGWLIRIGRMADHVYALNNITELERVDGGGFSGDSKDDSGEIPF